MMLPGVSSSAQVVELKDSMNVLDKLTDKELENSSIVHGLRLRRIAAEAERPVPFVVEVMHRYNHTAMMHAKMQKIKKDGEPLPETMEDLVDNMGRDPFIAKMDTSMRTFQRRMRRRGGK